VEQIARERGWSSVLLVHQARCTCPRAPCQFFPAPHRRSRVDPGGLRFTSCRAVTSSATVTLDRFADVPASDANAFSSTTLVVQSSDRPAGLTPGGWG